MKESIRHFFEILVSNYWGAVILILIGLFSILLTIRHPQKDSASPLQGDIKGWAGGLSCILLGLVIIVLKFLDKL